MDNHRRLAEVQPLDVRNGSHLLLHTRQHTSAPSIARLLLSALAISAYASLMAIYSGQLWQLGEQWNLPLPALPTGTLPESHWSSHQFLKYIVVISLGTVLRLVDGIGPT
jgi:hypothetical protein